MAESTATETPHKPYRRNLHGQYFDGTIGGPGNPHARNVEHLRKTVNEAISPAMVEKVIDSIFQLALTGNIPAARLFLQYAVGKPAPAESPDRVDVEEWQLRKESSVDYAEALPFIHQSPLDCVNMLVRTYDVGARQTFYKTVIGIFTQPSAPPAPEQTVPTTEQTVPTGEQTIPTEEQTVPTAEQTVPTAEQTVPTAEQTATSTEQKVPTAEQTVRLDSLTPQTGRANGSHGAKTRVAAPIYVTVAPISVPDTDRVA